MSEPLLNILDRALQFSLWAFLGSLVVTLFFISWRLRSRRRRLGDYFREEVDGRYEESIGGERSAGIRDQLLLTDRSRMAFQAMLLSAALALLTFGVAAFVPLPGFRNFATASAWKLTPLRVTSVQHQRSVEGFSLVGEVWNQGDTTILGLRARILIWGADDELLDRVSVPVTPERLPPDSAGSFSVRYQNRSPLLFGYQLSFETASGEPIAHVEGFDVP